MEVWLREGFGGLLEGFGRFENGGFSGCLDLAECGGVELMEKQN